jgi:hypothetical protein
VHRLRCVWGLSCDGGGGSVWVVGVVVDGVCARLMVCVRESEWVYLWAWACV